MTDMLTPVSLTVDLRRNTIEIATGEGGGAGEDVVERRLLEMGVRGRLLGIDFDVAYLTVCPPGDDDLALARTVAAEVTVQRDAAGRIRRVSVPRRGAGYEITFPSGNQ
jgi:hypothetical protein